MRLGVLMAALGLLAAPAAAQTPASPTSHPVSALIGLSPQEVQMRLAGDTAGFETPAPSLSVWTPAGTRAVLSADDLTRPVQRVPGARWCVSTIADVQTGPGGPRLVFRDGRLERVVFAPPITRAPSPERPAGMSDRAYSRLRWESSLRRPLQTVFPPSPGALPMEDGAAVLERLSAAPENAALLTTCRTIEPRAPRTGGGETNVAQGLALLPFAVALPGINAERARDRERGATTFAALELGEALPGGVEGFAKANSGIQVLRGLDPAFAIVAVNLGEAQSNNLSRRNEAGLAGVRDGRVVWLALPNRNASFPASLLCLNTDNVRGPVRPGCTEYGDYFIR